jgi:hypothetical protein
MTQGNICRRPHQNGGRTNFLQTRSEGSVAAGTVLKTRSVEFHTMLKKPTVSFASGEPGNSSAQVHHEACILLFSSIWRVSKPDDSVLTPAFIVEFGTSWIQLPPSRRNHDPILRNALAYQSLFDPIRSSL